MKFRILLGALVATCMMLFGVLIVLGYLLTPETSSELRWTLGIVMILFGIYRGALLYLEAKRSKTE